MDPATALAIGSAASGFGSGFFSPEGQDISSFQDAPGSGFMRTDDPFSDQARIVNIKPTQMLADAQGFTRSLAELFGDRAFQPVTRGNTLPSAFVQQPATFSGGGLPFDIGVTAFDAANPFRTPTPPPGGFSAAAQAFIDGMQGGGGAVGPGTGGRGGPGGGLRFDGDEGLGNDRGSNEPPINWNQFPKDPRPPEPIRPIFDPILPTDPGDPFNPPPELPPPGGGDGGDDEGNQDDRPTDPGEVLPPGAILPPGAPPGEVDTDEDFTLPPVIIPGPIINPLSAQQPQSPFGQQGGFNAGFQQGQGSDFLSTLKMLGAPMDQILRKR